MNLRAQALWRTQRGTAAAEFALVLAILVVPLLNVTDFGMYVYQGMELNDAAQIAVQAVWTHCNASAHLPATPNSWANCPAGKTAETIAAQSTSLGPLVTIASTTENYYCVNGSGVLVTVAGFPNNPPANCAAVVAGSTDKPGDYVLITVSFTYQPFFPAAHIASLFPASITRTAWMRLA